MTVIAGLVAHVFGPEIGGLFLAFPAILPASLTLVARHEGREPAAQEAGGAVLGAVALVAFGATVARVAPEWPPPMTLAAASAAWIVSALLLWESFSALAALSGRWRHRRRRRRHHRARRRSSCSATDRT